MKLAIIVAALLVVSSAHAEPTITILKTKPAPQATTGGTGSIERAMPGLKTNIGKPPPAAKVEEPIYEVTGWTRPVAPTVPLPPPDPRFINWKPLIKLVPASHWDQYDPVPPWGTWTYCKEFTTCPHPR